MTNIPYTDKEDPRMHRLWNPETKCYLHLSGAGETSNPDYSWLGFGCQADALRHSARQRGEPWPYVRKGRNDHLPGKDGGWA